MSFNQIIESLELSEAKLDRSLTVKNLVREFRDLEESDAKKLVSALKKARSLRQVEDALELADRILEGHGVELIKSDNYEVDSDIERFWGEGVVAAHVNTGDLYTPTILYEPEVDKFWLTDLGTWREKKDRHYKIEHKSQFNNILEALQSFKKGDLVKVDMKEVEKSDSRPEYLFLVSKLIKRAKGTPVFIDYFFGDKDMAMIEPKKRSNPLKMAVVPSKSLMKAGKSENKFNSILNTIQEAENE